MLGINNQKGFSLANVMVSVAILGIVSMAVLTLITQIMLVGSKSKFDADVINDLDLLRMQLRKSNICTANFRNLVINRRWAELPEDRMPLKLPRVIGGTELGPQPLLGDSSLVNKIEFRLEPGSTDVARVRLTFKAIAKVLGPSEIYRELMLSVTREPGGNIQSCSYHEGSNESKIDYAQCEVVRAVAGANNCSAADDIAIKKYDLQINPECMAEIQCPVGYVVVALNYRDVDGVICCKVK